MVDRLVSADASPSFSKNSGWPSPSTCTIASSSALPMANGYQFEVNSIRSVRCVSGGRVASTCSTARLAGLALDECEPGLEHRSLDLLHRGCLPGGFGRNILSRGDFPRRHAPADAARRGALHRSVRAHDGGGLLPRGDAGDRHLQPLRPPVAAHPRVHRRGRPGGRAGVRARPPLHPRRDRVPPLPRPVRARIPGVPRLAPLHGRDPRGARRHGDLPRRADARGHRRR